MKETKKRNRNTTQTQSKQRVGLSDQKNQLKIRTLRGRLKWEGKLDEMRRA